MSRLLLLIIALSTFGSFGQNKLDGKYSNHFGDSLIIQDSTYSLNINIDDYTNTFGGMIMKKKDTIYLTPSFNFNSIRRNNSSWSSKAARDSILKAAEKRETALIQKYEWRFRKPLILLVKDNRLYLINSKGNIDKREYSTGNKNFGTYFVKSQ